MNLPDGRDKMGVSAWLVRCLGRDDIAVHSASELGEGKSSRVWECEVTAGEGPPAYVVLKVYDPTCQAYTGLSPAEVARKHALALDELSRHRLPVPPLLGTAVGDSGAALATERVTSHPWSPDTRVEAARALARLHAIRVSDLSDELAELARRSPPNRGRVFNGVKGMAGHLDADCPQWRAAHPGLSQLLEALVESGEPGAEEMSLVHGDYFSANLLAASRGVCIVDWDLLSLGDPMWDLGFLVSADRDVREEEAEAAIAAYRATRPVAADRLRWNRSCWEAFWRLRELCDSPRLR